MRLPKSLQTLADHGIIEDVLRPLMSGKEAQIYLVVSKGEVCAAKIYKEAQDRSFKNRADYVEGRKVRNSRDQRAMSKGSKYGKSRDEDTWKSTEVDMIYRLKDAGVRVPTPHTFIDGVLVMELMKDHDGNPAPRLGDLHFSAEEATEIFHMLLGQVTRMLCAGVVHGDLSDFNVLLAWDGPVIIDFPQSVDPASNLNARSLLLRDIENLNRFLARFVPGQRRRPYGEELWSLYENNRLTPETRLTGSFKRSTERVDTSAVLELIGEANRDEEFRRRNAGSGTGRGAAPAGRRREVVIEKPAARGPRGGGGSQSRGTQGGAGAPGLRTGAGPLSGSAPRDNRDPRGLHQRPHNASPGGANRGGTNRGGTNRGGTNRGSAPRGRRDLGGPPGRTNAGPKRGDSVENSGYVSPEARKTHKHTLTLREDSSSSSRQSRAQRGASDSKGDSSQIFPSNRRREASESTGSARRRNRRPRSPGQGASSPQRSLTGNRQERSTSTAIQSSARGSTSETRREENPRPRRQRRRRNRDGSASGSSDA